jgi:hypothetical protein
MGKLDGISIEELKQEIANREAAERLQHNIQQIGSSPIGWWKVTTEGDCEGRSTRDLGIFEGHVVDIAYHLAKHAMYQLEFEPIDPPNIGGVEMITENKTVGIGFGIKSGTWDLKGDERAKAVELFLRKKPCSGNYNVKNGNTYASVILEITPKEK